MDDIINNNKIIVQKINNLPLEESHAESAKITIVIDKKILLKIKI